MLQRPAAGTSRSTAGRGRAMLWCTMGGEDSPAVSGSGAALSAAVLSDVFSAFPLVGAGCEPHAIAVPAAATKSSVPPRKSAPIVRLRSYRPPRRAPQVHPPDARV